MKLNALDLLMIDPANAKSEMSRALTDTHVLDELPEGTPPLAASAAKYLLSAVADALESMLAAIGLDEMLMGGWARLESVASALEATRADGGERHVSLLQHEITSHHEPRIEMLVDELPIQLMHLRLDASFVVDACGVLVRDGDVVEATPVKIGGDGELACGQVTLLKHAVPALDVSRLFAAAVTAR